MNLRVTRPADRGVALITVVGVVAFLLMVILSLLYYTSAVHRREIGAARGLSEQSCAESGLQIARNFFSSTYKSSSGWNTYLSQPQIYNPFGWNTGPGAGQRSIPKAGPNATPAEVLAAANLRANYPMLFADLDGDGKADVYLYIRNDDEGGGPMVEGNRMVIAGALCISDTMAPRRPDGTADPTLAFAEGYLFGIEDDDYIQKHAGHYGTGNYNTLLK
jgi:hypothetical protein